MNLEVEKFTQQQSVSTTLSRIMARSRGLPLPFAAGSVVRNADGKGHTMGTDYPILGAGCFVDAVCFPVFGSIGACVGVCRLLKMIK